MFQEAFEFFEVIIRNVHFSKEMSKLKFKKEIENSVWITFIAVLNFRADSISMTEAKYNVQLKKLLL